jgi:putative Ca2+/H+ antiporter (TMEM165/GDT1 family)
MSIGALLGVFALMFLLELPDKTMIATVVMATRARPRNVAIGASLGFVVQMALAVAAGSLLTLLPAQIKNLIVALLFLGGAAFLLLVKEKEEEDEGTAEAQRERPGTAWREMFTAFSVIFIGEFGDLTQIQAANFSAKYHQPIGVFLSGSLALVLVAFIGAYGGKFLQRYVALEKIRFAGGLLFLALGLYSLYQLRHW